MAAQTLSPRRIQRLPAVLEATGLSRSTFYELMARGEFPRGRRIAGTKAVGWDSLEVEAFVSRQLDGTGR